MHFSLTCYNLINKVVLLWDPYIKIKNEVPFLYQIRTTAKENQRGQELRGKFVFQANNIIYLLLDYYNNKQKTKKGLINKKAR